MDLKLVLFTFCCIFVTSSICHSKIGCELKGQCGKGLSRKIDTIFSGEIVKFFPKKKENKRKNVKERKKRKQKEQDCDFKNRRKREKCLKNSFKNTSSALVEVKQFYSGMFDENVENPYIVVEGFSNVDKVGETKLFLSTKLFDGVYKIVQPGLNSTTLIKLDHFIYQHNSLKCLKWSRFLQHNNKTLVKLKPGLPLTKSNSRKTNQNNSRENLLYNLFYGHEIKRKDAKGKNKTFYLLLHFSV